MHGLAAPLGGTIAIPHGSACARLLPLVMEANLRALNARAMHSPALARYDEVARLVTGSNSARAGDGVDWIKSLVSALLIPKLAVLGLSEADVPLIVRKALASSSMKGNPVQLTPEELTEILEKAL